jgi:hypothetical protein
MDMVACPHCGTQNSSKRDYCFQCNGALRGEKKPAPQASQQYVPTCSSCSQAAIYPPRGQRLTANQVWCSHREKAVPADMVAGECFSEAFGWRREEIAD